MILPLICNKKQTRKAKKNFKKRKRGNLLYIFSPLPQILYEILYLISKGLQCAFDTRIDRIRAKPIAQKQTSCMCIMCVIKYMNLICDNN